MISTYRARSKVVRAVQFDGTNGSELLGFAPSVVKVDGGKILFEGEPLLERQWVVEWQSGEYRRRNEADFWVNYESAAAVSLWWGYFGVTPIPADDVPHVLQFLPGQIGSVGNVGLFTNLSDGVQFNSDVIIQATVWALVTTAAISKKWLGLQLDKEGTLLNRAHTAFVETAANVTYGGVLMKGEKLRAVALAATSADEIQQGFMSVIAVPI